MGIWAVNACLIFPSVPSVLSVPFVSHISFIFRIRLRLERHTLALYQLTMRKLLLLTLIAILPAAVCTADEGVLRFDNEGFTIDSTGFQVKSKDPQTNAYGTLAAFLYLPPSQGFAPNVNVLIQDVPNTIKEYADMSKEQFKTVNLTVLNDHLVGDGEWACEYSGNMQGKDLHFYARALKKGDKVYLITGTATPDQWDSAFPKLKSCVDSFTFTQ
jgi:hypothetical protein